MKYIQCIYLATFLLLLQNCKSNNTRYYNTYLNYLQNTTNFINAETKVNHWLKDTKIVFNTNQCKYFIDSLKQQKKITLYQDSNFVHELKLDTNKIKSEGDILLSELFQIEGIRTENEHKIALDFIVKDNFLLYFFKNKRPIDSNLVTVNDFTMWFCKHAQIYHGSTIDKFLLRSSYILSKPVKDIVIYFRYPFERNAGVKIFWDKEPVISTFRFQPRYKFTLPSSSASDIIAYKFLYKDIVRYDIQSENIKQIQLSLSNVLQYVLDQSYVYDLYGNDYQKNYLVKDIEVVENYIKNNEHKKLLGYYFDGLNYRSYGSSWTSAMKSKIKTPKTYDSDNIKRKVNDVVTRLAMNYETNILSTKQSSLDKQLLNTLSLKNYIQSTASEQAIIRSLEKTRIDLISLINLESPSKNYENYTIHITGNYAKQMELHYSESQLEIKAYNFLLKHYRAKFGNKKVLSLGQSPPQVIINKVKNCVSYPNNYWEIIQVTITKVELKEDTSSKVKNLLIRCSVEGDYIDITTPFEPKDSIFDRSLDLEKGFYNALKDFGQRCIDNFSNRLSTN